MPETKMENQAIWSLVLGILSLPPFPFGFITGIPAIIIGNRALKSTILIGKGLARAGIIMGYLSVIISVVLIILIFSGVIKP